MERTRQRRRSFQRRLDLRRPPLGVQLLPAAEQKTTRLPKLRINRLEDPRVGLEAERHEHPHETRLVVCERLRSGLATALERVVNQPKAEVSPVPQLFEVEAALMLTELDAWVGTEGVGEVEAPVAVKAQLSQSGVTVFERATLVEELRRTRHRLAKRVFSARRSDKAKHDRFEPMGEVVERPQPLRSVSKLWEVEVEVNAR